MSKGQATTTGYYVEARCADGLDSVGVARPPKVGNQYLGATWRRLHTHEGTCGVNNDILDCVARHHHVLTYAAAKAIMAGVAADFTYRISIEFRLVKVKVESSYTITEEGHSAPEKFDWFAAAEVDFTPVPAPSATEEETL